MTAILIGWAGGLTPLAGRLQARWRDGTLADKALFPRECVTPLGEAGHLDPARLVCLKFVAIAWGGLLRGGLRAGRTVLVSGATGCLGASAVYSALALGAARVIALGRDRATLDRLVALDPRRVTPVALSGSPADHRRQILSAVDGAADLSFDALGTIDTPEQTRACVDALRPGGAAGAAVWMGGVRAEIPLPYGAIMRRQLSIVGAFMHAPHVPGDLLRLAAAGVLDLLPLEPRTFPLERIEEAVKVAATLKGLQFCVITP